MNQDEYDDDLFNECEEVSGEKEKIFELSDETNVFDEHFDTFEPKNELDNNIKDGHNEIERDDEIHCYKSPKFNKIKPKNKIGRITQHQKLNNNGENKECRRCHEIKSHDEFEMRNDIRRDKPYLRSICKKCKLEKKQIYALSNKFKVLTNIYKGKFSKGCPECRTEIYKLPTFDFHHPSSISKRTTWYKRMYKFKIK